MARPHAWPRCGIMEPTNKCGARPMDGMASAATAAAGIQCAGVQCVGLWGLRSTTTRSPARSWCPRLRSVQLRTDVSTMPISMVYRGSIWSHEPTSTATTELSKLGQSMALIPRLSSATESRGILAMATRSTTATYTTSTEAAAAATRPTCQHRQSTGRCALPRDVATRRASEHGGI